MSTSIGRRAPRPWWRRRRTLWGFYVLLLLVHHGMRLRPAPSPSLGPHEDAVALHAVRGKVRLDRQVRVVFRDEGPRDAPVMLLLHGSPGGLHDFDAVVERLGDRYRVVALDLPGFGRSEHRVPDYSVRAHADYALQLLDALGIERCTLVAFSLGGGVALELYDRRPERVDSLVLVASIGVQEMELLGSYDLNHLLHGVQLVAAWTLDHLVPHMGVLDGFPLGLPYARNFFDTDQRPLRGILRRLEPAVLILHGEHDPLVPYEAAVEHARLVPQAELVKLPASHFLLWTQANDVAEQLRDWMGRLAQGTLATRRDATADRRTAAQDEFPPTATARARGLTVFVLVMLLVLGTFLTEDLTSIAAGLLIAQGRISWAVGLGAVFCGIYFGDLLLYLLGRRLGRAVLRRAPWKWLVKPADLDTAARWFDRRGLTAILLTRFVPGTRLPTYVAAGVVRARFWRFALYFLVAVALWTPILVGFAAVVGQKALTRLERYRHDSLLLFIVTALFVLVLVRIIVPLMTARGRRLLVGHWRRWRHHEFWPAWLFYAPVAAHVLLRASRYGGLRTLTAVNPGIEAGGFVGESKSEILEAFGDDARVARFTLLPGGEDVRERLLRVEAFLRVEGLTLPVVVKPDVGQRGEGVRIVRDFDELTELLAATKVDLIAQEYVEGPEFGIFYIREPGHDRGRIFSITEKVRPTLVGDGIHSLEHLILHDRRAVCLASLHLRVHAAQLDRVPGMGESVELVEVGTHARGAVFLDGHRLATRELEAAIDALSQRFDGFWFGRYDLRVTSVEELQAGRGWKVLELNGLTSEATHIYDPRMSLRAAYRVLFEQWELAFRIGAAHRADGTPTTSLRALWEAWRHHREHRRRHPPLPGDASG